MAAFTRNLQESSIRKAWAIKTMNLELHCLSLESRVQGIRLRAHASQKLLRNRRRISGFTFWLTTVRWCVHAREFVPVYVNLYS